MRSIRKGALCTDTSDQAAGYVKQKIQTSVPRNFPANAEELMNDALDADNA